MRSCTSQTLARTETAALQKAKRKASNYFYVYFSDSTYDLQIMKLTHYTLKNSETLATNKAENRCYEISNATDRVYS